MRERFKISRNIKLLPLFHFLLDFRITSIIEILYFADILNSYALAMSVFSVSLFSAAVFEVITGIFSDKIGRVKTLMSGLFFDILSIVLFGLASFCYPFLLLFLGAVLFGVAESFYSGTLDALSFETVKQLKKEHKYSEFSGKLDAMGQISLASSALLAGIIAYKFSYVFVIWAGLVPLILCFFLCVFLIEPKIKRNNQLSSFEHLKIAWNNIKKNKKLKMISLAKIIGFGVGTSSHRFEAVYFASLIPMWLVGIIRFIKQFGGFIGFWFSGRIIEKIGNKNTLYTTRAVMILIKIVALLINSFITPFLLSFLNLFFAPLNTSLKNLMQKEFSDEQRATMGSIVSIFGSLFFGVFTVFLGFLADFTNPRIALFSCVCFNSVTLLIYKSIFKKR